MDEEVAKSVPLPDSLMGLEPLEWKGEIAVVALGGEELLAAAAIALAFEGVEEARPTLAYLAEEDHPFAASIAGWFEEQSRDVPVERWAPGSAPRDAHALVVVGTWLPPRRVVAHLTRPGALYALVGAGVDAAELDATRTRLMQLASVGAIRGVELVARYGRVGREFIELVEHLHHETGPEGQSRVADTLRAALFGRSGRVPVNLASREDPPLLDPLTLLVFFVDLDEL